MRTHISSIASLLLTARVGTTSAVADADLGAVDASDAVADDTVEEATDETDETVTDPEEDDPVVPVLVVVDPEPVSLESNAQKKDAIDFDATFDDCPARL